MWQGFVLYLLVVKPKDFITGDEVHSLSLPQPYTSTLKGKYMQFL